MRLTPTHDVQLIRRLATDIWLAHYPQIIGMEQTQYMLDKMYSEERLNEQIKDNQIFLFILNSDEQPIGFIGYRSANEPQTYFIDKFYLSHELQGKGVGSIAFQKFIDILPPQSVLRLRVNRQNYKSVNFYFKNGFVIEECVDVAIGDGFEMNDFVMVRS